MMIVGVDAAVADFTIYHYGHIFFLQYPYNVVPLIFGYFSPAVVTIVVSGERIVIAELRFIAFPVQDYFPAVVI